MRSTTLRSCLLLGLLALAPAALAAPAAPARESRPPAREAPAAREAGPGAPHLGVGLAVTGADTFAAGGPAPVSLYLPIDLGTLRIEPWLGFGRQGASGGGPSTTVVALGAGGFLMVRPSRTFQAYAGGRLGLAIVSVGSTAGTASQSRTDIQLLPAAGVEWLADPHFSFGIEGQVGLVVHTGGGSSSTDLGTNGLFFLRAYQ